MPIYMDFHDVPKGITAKHVAEMHQADLKIEHKYNCRGLTYWCDERRQTAFCLIEAPNEQAIIDLHEEAHGDIPQRIIEVNDTIVESFLGRIEDPVKSQNIKLNIINESAFRTLMVINIKKHILRTENIETLNAAIRGYKKSIINIINSEDGRLVKQEGNSFLMSFTCVTNAVQSAIKIQELYNCVITPDLEFNIGLSAGVPVTENENIFEDTIKEANFLCYIIKGEIIISPEIKDLYESENQNNPIYTNGVKSLTAVEKEFVINLLDYTNTVWKDTKTSALDFSKNLGLSKSKLYRTMMSIIGKSPNSFLKEYRLNKALELLDRKTSNISEIAYQTGFSSPTYFSKCFQEAHGILPSNYIKSQLL
ncbi:Helix-turn-helix domain-containing protein [Formosa sp. Hel1_31_208]|uniref:nickel-binding protein n=1 Tax=Formosa sp. Hel1_31_208 TaxID=1798225 RepID=UPI00087ABF26|nr:nickel-binding protein [Formosa sp. Hel1_31_208]SDS40072.1 Helix-turn-helix domain-containing protein [Formosa sp. Hel1_31_208]